ncbi:Histidinol-phosphate/aromatic aminotransferase and cobyric acid decarboxylase [Hahella chejuensis KCTC 2396]|uniref:threonine-phosphate decarboxylase n=1 Tax=Hahella chejuensis (strain KCTC 2396) TaxID=349521 RepID=Q2S8B9_HAHCH|nr:threonine-phosphate decarboxylase CobD [Hahella chejuensis]ABC33105.1 Histidinol-phosphate/aromatic aminotransferase and cobyric acid decarboxylase [Hahella chejuensis KCTC 2396]
MNGNDFDNGAGHAGPQAEEPVPVHGGDLGKYSQLYGIDPDDWLDLSTGVSPFPYPLTSIPAQVFRRLPYFDPALQQAASAYYGTDSLLAIPGAQWAIQHLPACCAPGAAALPDVGYREHEHHWRRQGFNIVHYPAGDLAGAAARLAQTENLRVLVVINPNNPAARTTPLATLRELAQGLQTRGAVLVADEAFADAEADSSLLGETLPENVVVLRSFGKFFGWPGVRLGFVAAAPYWLAALQRQLGPWTVNSAAQYVATRALRDEAWIVAMRDKLARVSESLQDLLLAQPALKTALECRRTSLFVSVLTTTAQAERIFQRCAQRGVLIRLWRVNAELAYLRFGLFDLEDAGLAGRLTAALDNK